MARKPTQASVVERLTVIETELPHMLDDLHAVRKQLELLSRYFRAATLLGSAAVIHMAGDRFAEFSAATLQFALKVLLG